MKKVSYLYLFLFNVMLYYVGNQNKGVIKMTINKDTIIGSILDVAPETAPFFLEMGMHCLGCPSARGETIEQACMVHGVDADELIAKINASLANK